MAVFNVSLADQRVFGMLARHRAGEDLGDQPKPRPQVAVPVHRRAGAHVADAAEHLFPGGEREREAGFVAERS